ncbi:MAG: PP2C family serine/threonine-protein phosphatase [Sarcina sp.]
MKKLEKWVGVTAKVQGRFHEVRNLPCQDYVHSYTDDEVAIIALSDGAGSCSHSEYGAKVAVKTIINLFKKEFLEIEVMDGLKAKRYISSSIIREIKKEMVKHEGTKLKDFSGTLLFVAIKDKHVIAGHIGDGIIGYVINNEVKVLSKPQNGESANSTYFFTMDNVENKFNLIKDKLYDIDAFVVMSDGTGNTLYSTKREILSKGIIKLTNWKSESNSKKFNSILQENLSEIIKKKTTDDCSIGILYKHKDEMHEILNLEDSELQRELIGLSIDDEKGFINFTKVYKQIFEVEKKRTSIKRMGRLVKLKRKIVSRHLRRIDRLYGEGKKYEGDMFYRSKG